MKKINVDADKNSIDEFVEELQQHPSLAKFKITEFNANLFYNVLQEHNNCRSCIRINDCKNDFPGHYSMVIADNNNYKVKMRTCKFKRAANAIAFKQAMIKSMYVPKTYLKSQLSDFKLTTPTRQKIYNYLINFVENYSKENNQQGLFLSGGYGVGKTYALAALTNALADKGVESMIIYFPNLVREFKNSIGTTRLDDLVNLLKTINVLIFDDLGSEQLSEWFRDEILGDVITYRLAEELPLFISSNLSHEQLLSHLSNSKNSVDVTKGARIHNKIMDLTIYCQIEDEKFSMKKKL